MAWNGEAEESGRAHGGSEPSLERSRRETSGFWPSAEHEDLLRCALRPLPSATAALERWLARGGPHEPDYPSLTLHPLLYSNLVRQDARPDLRQRLRGAHRWSWHRNQLLFRAVEGILARLRVAGIEALAMKGLPLALATYPDSGARVMGDADLVVRREDVRHAAELLQGLGWRAERPLDEATMWSLNGVSFTDRGGRIVDLQWTILPDNFDPSNDRPLWNGAGQIEVGSERVRVLSASDHLLEVICHGLGWAVNPPVHWVADAVLLSENASEPLDWDRLVDRAIVTRRVLVARRGLRYLASRFGAPVPERVLAALESAPVDRRQRTAFWFSERSGAGYPWGRAPLVAACYVRSARARGRRASPGGFLDFAATRARCRPRRWLRLAAVGAAHQASGALIKPALSRRAGVGARVQG